MAGQKTAQYADPIRIQSALYADALRIFAGLLSDGYGPISDAFKTNSTWPASWQQPPAITHTVGHAFFPVFAGRDVFIFFKQPIKIG